MKASRIMRFFYFGFFSLILAGCTRYYSLLPEIYTLPINNPQQVEIHGPFRVQIISGSPKSQLILAAGMGGQLTEVDVKQTEDKLIIMPTRSAVATDIPHILVRVYLRNPGSLMVDGASSLKIVNQQQRSYNLILKNVTPIQFTGNAILPNLLLENTGYFAPQGQIYLGNLVQNNTGNISINRLKGGAINIYANGPGNIYLNGTNLGFVSIVHQGPGSIVIQNKGRPTYPKPLTIQTTGGPLILNGMINSSLHVNPDSNGVIKMSGYVDKIYLNLHGNIQFNCPQLMAYDTYIRTYQSAFVRLSVKNRIFVNTFDQSRVEYYGYPPYKFAQSRNASAVLQLYPPKGGYSAT